MFFGVIMKMRRMVGRYSGRSRNSNVNRLCIAVGLILGFIIIFTTFKMASWTLEGEVRQETPRREQSIYGGEMQADTHVRHDTCHFCMGSLIHGTKDVISSHVCKPDGMDDEAERDDLAPHTLFVIITSEERGRYRKALRQTWLQHTRFNTDADYRHVFYMGIKNGKTVSSAVKLEQYVHDDLVVGNFTDNPANETVKLMKALSHAAIKCENAERVLVTTDNVLFNNSQYLRYLRRHRLHAAVGGQCMYGITVQHSTKGSPWHSTQNENPWGYYPDFCLANSLVIENTTLRDLVYQSSGIPFFRISSIYLGFVMDYIKAKAVTMDGFYARISDYDPCTSSSSAAVIELDDRANLTSLWTKQCNTLKAKSSSRKEETKVPRSLAPNPRHDSHLASATVVNSVNKFPVKAKGTFKRLTDFPPVNANVVLRLKSSPVKETSLRELPAKVTDAIVSRPKPLPVRDIVSLKPNPKSLQAKTTIALEQKRKSSPAKGTDPPKEQPKSLPLNESDGREQQHKPPSSKDVALLKKWLKVRPVKNKDSL